MLETNNVGWNTYGEGVPDGDEEANELEVRLGDLDVAKTEYKQALDDLSGDLRWNFSLLRDDQLEEAEELIRSFYLINQEKNRREEIRLKERLAEKRIYR